MEAFPRIWSVYRWSLHIVDRKSIINWPSRQCRIVQSTTIDVRGSLGHKVSCTEAAQGGSPVFVLSIPLHFIHITVEEAVLWPT